MLNVSDEYTGDFSEYKSVRIPLCPRCLYPITHWSQMYGQKSYTCKPCNSWGPWTFRLTIRNPNKPKKKKNG